MIEITLPDKSKRNFEKPPSIYELAQDIGPCLLYTSPSPRDPKTSRMPSSA